MDFSVYEMDTSGGHVPSTLASELNGNTWRMHGTDIVPIRCTALTGTVGEQVGCSIYALRPSPCRAFTEGSEACHRARSKLGLPALQDA